jgi:hypothetical protein
MLKKGDRVLVWSLQSFSNGGFLKGEPAFLRQSENGNSIILCVIRNFGGEDKIDENYEVYREQVVKVEKNNWNAKKILKQFRKEILANVAIS